MFPELAAPKTPIAIRPEHIVDKNTTFRVQQHGRGLSSGKFTIFSPSEDATASEGPVPGTKAGQAEAQQPQTLFSVDGKYMSRQQRRSFQDASGMPLFDLYYLMLKSTWYVELPGGNGMGDSVPIAQCRPRSGPLKDSLGVDVRNAATENGEEVKLLVRAQDVWKQRTNVYLEDGRVVMTAKRTEKMAVYLPGKKLEWDVDIAAGFDMSLASVIVVLLATIAYDSSQQSSSYT